ncbi:hypothetical protein WMY93_001682 [Mugilogobius chulae]|uniref:Uncharacterized protein n=1 Tax=Mugilogobius chulae TaxID=88201 RepID=A0AAW0PXF2_9GOBI
MFRRIASAKLPQGSLLSQWGGRGSSHSKYIKCEQCGNPKGNKCVFNLCRGCCKKKAFKEVADCPSHGLKFKTKAEKRRLEGEDVEEEEERRERRTGEEEKKRTAPPTEPSTQPHILPNGQSNS